MRIVSFRVQIEIPYDKRQGIPHNEMAKVLDCELKVSEFALQSRYYVHFQTNTLGKGMNPLMTPDIG